MATKLDPIIWGKDKSINYSKISVGALAKAVSEDLEEFGEKGVQGVKLGSNLGNFLNYEKAAKRAADPYYVLGVHSNGSLILVLRDKKNDKFEAMEVAVKGYEAIKAKLANASAKVVNISKDKEESSSRAPPRRRPTSSRPPSRTTTTRTSAASRAPSSCARTAGRKRCLRAASLATSSATASPRTSSSC